MQILLLLAHCRLAAGEGQIYTPLEKQRCDLVAKGVYRNNSRGGGTKFARSAKHFFDTP